jgi:hypothetical protein
MDAITVGLGNIPQLAHRTFGELEGVPHSLTIKTEFPSDDFVGNGAFARDFRKGLGSFFAVTTVFQLLEAGFKEPEVAYRNDRRQRLAIVFQENRVAVTDKLDGIGQVIVCAIEDSLGHAPIPLH